MSSPRIEAERGAARARVSRNSAEVMTRRSLLLEAGQPPSALFVIFRVRGGGSRRPEGGLAHRRPPASSSSRRPGPRRILRSGCPDARREGPVASPPSRRAGCPCRCRSASVLPPAFSAMLPPIVQAQALVGSVAKTGRGAPSLHRRSVMTPASSAMTLARAGRPSASAKARSSTPRIWSSRSVFTMTQRGRSGPRRRSARSGAAGIAWSPRAAIAASSGATWRSRSGTRPPPQEQAPVGGIRRVRHEGDGVEEDVSAPTIAPRRRRTCRAGGRRASRRKLR